MASVAYSKQIQCHCLSQNSLQRAAPADCYHVGMHVQLFLHGLLIVSPKCHILCVCGSCNSVFVMSDGGGSLLHNNERRLGGSYQFGSALWLRAVTTPSQHAFNNRRPVTSRGVG